MTAPPSPVVMVFTGWNEKQQRSLWAQLPTGPLGVDGPEGVGGVLDDDPRTVGERGEVDRAARRSAPPPDRVDVSRDASGVEVQRGRVDVDEARRRRRRSAAQFGAGGERERRGGDEVARTEAGGVRRRRAGRRCRSRTRRRGGRRSTEQMSASNASTARPLGQPVALQHARRRRRCRRRRCAGGRRGSSQERSRARRASSHQSLVFDRVGEVVVERLDPRPSGGHRSTRGARGARRRRRRRRWCGGPRRW